MSHLYMQHRVGDVAPAATRVGRPNSHQGGRGYVVAKRSSSPTSVTGYDIEHILFQRKRYLLKWPLKDFISCKHRYDCSSGDHVPIPLWTPSLLLPHLQASKRLLSTTSNTQQKKAKSNLVTTAILLDRNRESTTAPLLLARTTAAATTARAVNKPRQDHPASPSNPSNTLQCNKLI